MKKKSLFKNFYRSIFNTFPKFLSITLLVALGVMAFVGLKITAPIMKRSIEKKVKEGYLYDFMISSNYGLLKEDEEIISKLEDVKDVEFGYSVNLKDKEKNLDIYLESISDKISKIKIIKGRSIEKNDEILLDERLKDTYNLSNVFCRRNHE